MPNRIKIERLQKKIQDDLAELIFQRLSDPRLRFGSVTGVKLSGDYRHAKVFVSCLGSEADRRTFLRALDAAKGLLQGEIGRRLQTRVTPLLAFEYDPSVERSVAISQLIDKAVAQDDEIRRARGGEEGRTNENEAKEEEE